MIMDPIDTTDPAAELAKSQSQLDRLMKLQQNTDNQTEDAVDETTSDENNAAANNDVATSLYKRAKEAQDEIQLIQLQREVINLVNVTVKNSQRDGAVIEGGAEAALSTAKDQCTSLGFVLIRHANHHHGKTTKTGQLYAKLMAWYTNLHKDTRQMTCNLFRAHLQKEAPEYPSNLQSSNVIADIFSPSSAQQTHQQQQQQSWLDVAKCLIELQIVHDAVQMVQTRTIDTNKHLSPQWRFDIVDELCRPIAERLRYHFLGEQSGLFTASSPGGVESEKVSTIDRLPEWLFRYLREIIENHGAHSVVMIEGVQPLTDAMVDSLLVRTQFLSAEVEDGVSSDADVSARDVFMVLKQMYFGHSSVYFLREISRMARHALRANSFLNHPDMVGSECRDRSIALRGIEQLFLFDDLMKNKIESDQEGEILGIDPILYPVRLTDTFLTPREDLLLWWMGDERDIAIARLQKCAASTLPSCQSHDEDGSSSTNISNQQLCPPITDLFAALLYSSRSKANAFSDLRPQQMYVATVVAPLCSAYLELMHGEATLLRQRLLSRDITKSFSGSDEMLTASVLEWISMITGVHMAGQAVLRVQTTQNRESDRIHSDHSNPLDDVIKSVFVFADAMVDEFVSVFVEQIMMERAKLAGYTMRAPFLISECPHEHHERRGQREKDVKNALTLSPDLNDSIHVLSITLKACQSAAAKVDSMDIRTAGMKVATESHLQWASWIITSRVLTVQGPPESGTANRLLIPLIDMCNHDRDSPHILTGRAMAGATLKVVAGVDVKAGDAINISYGGSVEGNDRFIQDYGFLDGGGSKERGKSEVVEAYKIVAKKLTGRNRALTKMTVDDQTRALEALKATTLEQDQELLKCGGISKNDERSALEFRIGMKKALAGVL